MAAREHDVVIIFLMACFITTGFAGLKCYDCISDNMSSSDECNTFNEDTELECNIPDIRHQLLAYQARNERNMTKAIDAIKENDFHCLKIIINNKLKEDKYVIRSCAVKLVGAVMFCDIVREVLPTSNLTDAPGKVEECVVCKEKNLCNTSMRLPSTKFCVIYSTVFLYFIRSIMFKSFL